CSQGAATRGGERAADAGAGDLVAFALVELARLGERAGGVVAAAGETVDVGECAERVGVQVEEVGLLGPPDSLGRDREGLLVTSGPGEGLGVGGAPLHLCAEVVAVGVQAGDLADR